MFRHQVCGIDCASDLLDLELLVLLLLFAVKKFFVSMCFDRYRSHFGELIHALLQQSVPDSYWRFVSQVSRIVLASPISSLAQRTIL